MRRDRHAKIVATFALRPGDSVAIPAGMPFRTPGTTNMLEIRHLEFMGPMGGGGEA
jgi:mannose-6-phosphate isomerase-like protein (cupin superfamily)